jgi:hypothetical protein
VALRVTYAVPPPTLDPYTESIPLFLPSQRSCVVDAPSIMLFADHTMGLSNFSAGLKTLGQMLRL